MSWSRTVKWDHPDKVPSFEELKHVLEDYLGDLGQVESKNDSYLQAVFVTRDGTESRGCFPFRRISLVADGFRAAQQQHLSSRERWIEVDKYDDWISVSTRQQDEFTNNIATGFAQMVARFWHGEFDAGG